MKTASRTPYPATGRWSARIQVLVVMALADIGIVLAADPLDHWEARYPDPAASFFVHGGDGWLGFDGVGGIQGSGGIFRSTNADFWRASTIPPDFVPMPFGDGGAAFGNGRWVVAGQIGTNGLDLFSALFSSDDGAFWEAQTAGLDLMRSLGVDPELRLVAHDGDGLWIAMGRQGRYLTSADGMTWIPRALPGTPHALVRSVSHGDGNWLALTPDATYLSPDGITWVRHDNPSALITAEFSAGHWIGLTDPFLPPQRIMSSSDGIAWTERAVAGASDTYWKLAHGAGLWLAAGVMTEAESGRDTLVTLTSSDGIRWQRHHTSIEIRTLKSLSHGEGMWILSGGTGSLLSSTDGVQWTDRIGPGIPMITALEIAGGLHVATGANPDSGDHPGFQ